MSETQHTNGQGGEPRIGPNVDAVEEAFRDAIREACGNVTASAEEAPSDLKGDNAEQAASAANVATVWTNVAVGLTAGLERFRLAHDLVKGGQVGKVGGSGAFEPDDEAKRLNDLVGTIRQEAEQGASPTRIAQLIDGAGFTQD